MQSVSTDATKIQVPSRRRFARLLPAELEATVQRVISTLFELQEVPDLNPHEARAAAEHTVEQVTKNPLDAYIATRQALLAKRSEIRNGLVKLPDPGPMRVIEVQGWPLALINEAKDDEPRVSATVLGERLGYGDRAGQRTRELIRRLEKDGEIAGVYMAREPRGISKPNGGTEVREVDEPYLTEVQTVIVVMHVRTPIAKALRPEIARVFVEANKLRRQQIQPHGTFDLAGAVGALARQVQTLTDLVTQQHAAPKFAPGVIGRVGAREITAGLNQCVALLASCYPEGDKSLRRRLRGLVENELRSHLGYTGNGSVERQLSLVVSR